MGRLIYTDTAGQEVSVPFGPENPMVTIGRATDCTIQCNRKSVSRRHAQFTYSPTGYEVIDLNSSNGTYLIINENRQPVKPRATLTHNDEIWCGDFILYFYDEVQELADADSDPTYHSVDLPDFARNGQPPQNQGVYGNPQPNPYQQPYQQNPYAQPYQQHTPTPNPSVGFGNPQQQPEPQQLDPFGAQPIEVEPYNPHQMDPFGAQPAAPTEQPAVDPYNPLEVEPYQSDPFQADPYQVDPYKADPYQVDPFGAQPYQPNNDHGISVEPYNPISDPILDQATTHDPYGAQPYEPIEVEPYQPQISAEPFDPISDASNTSVDAKLDELIPVSWNPNDTSQDVSFHQMQPPTQDHLHTAAQPSPDPMAEQLLVEKQMLEEVVAQQSRELDELKKQLRIKTKELETARHTSNTSSQATINSGHEQLQAELESAREEQRLLEEKLHAALQNAARGQEHFEALQTLQQQHTAIDIQLQEARVQIDALEQQARQVPGLTTQLDQLRADLSLRDEDNTRLRQQLQEQQRTLDDNQRALQSAQDGSSQAESLRRELERNKRLLDEFERRNRSLQQELDESEAELKTLRVQVEDLDEDASTYKSLATSREAQVEELTAKSAVLAEELATLRASHESNMGEANTTAQALAALQQSYDEQLAEHQALKQNHESVQAQLEQALEAIENNAPTMRVLNQEVEGLKQRVRMEKDRAKTAIKEKERLEQALQDVSAQVQEAQHNQEAAQQAQAVQTQQAEQIQHLQQTIEDLQAKLDEQANIEVPVPEPVDLSWLNDAANYAEKLNRIVDAIERVDTSGLGPVDRVRLRSALKDTTPAQTLEALLAIIDTHRQ